MYHFSLLVSVTKNAAYDGGIYAKTILLAFLLCALALLVSNTAAGLASRLAGSLALAATAILCALAKVTSLNCLDMFHNKLPPNRDDYIL